MAKVDYGAVALIPVGDYSASRQYHANELVGYQGSSYIALQNPPVGTLPTNTTYFMLHTEGTSIATASTPGTVKPDGTSTVVDSNGAMSVKPSILQTIQDTSESATESAAKIGNVPTGKTLQSQIDGLEPRVSSSEQALTVNLLNPILESQTANGITVTRNADNTYTLNGTATLRADFSVKMFTATKSQNVRITGCSQGGTENTFYIAVSKAPYWSGIVRDLGYGANIELSAGESYNFLIVIKSGTVCDNLVFKPMLTTNLSATYDDFVPFSGSSGKLDTDYKALSAKIGNVGNTDLQSQLNAATQSIAQNTTDIAANAAGISALNNNMIEYDHSGNMNAKIIANDTLGGIFEFKQGNAIGHFKTYSNGRVVVERSTDNGTTWKNIIDSNKLCAFTPSNVTLTTDANGNATLSNSSSTMIISARARGNYIVLVGNDAGSGNKFFKVFDVFMQPVTNTSVTIDYIYVNY